MPKEENERPSLISTEDLFKDMKVTMVYYWLSYRNVPIEWNTEPSTDPLQWILEKGDYCDILTVWYGRCKRTIDRLS